MASFISNPRKIQNPKNDEIHIAKYNGYGFLGYMLSLCLQEF